MYDRTYNASYLRRCTMQTLAQIAVWVLFISGLLLIIGPTIMGLTKKALVGAINSVEDGKLWFYRYGLGFIIGCHSNYRSGICNERTINLSTMPTSRN